MTNEEWDRKTEFLLNQQAKFDAGMQELKEAQAITEKKVAEAAEAARRAGLVAEVAMEGVSQLTDITDRVISTMSDGFRAASDRMKDIDDKIDVLVNSQILTEESLRATDKRLRDLTGLFDRHIREDHRGRNSSEN